MKENFYFNYTLFLLRNSTFLLLYSILSFSIMEFSSLISIYYNSYDWKEKKDNWYIKIRIFLVSKSLFHK